MGTREGRDPTDVHAPAPASEEARMRAMLLALGMRRTIELLADVSEKEADRIDGKTSPDTTQRFAYRTNAGILRGIAGKLY